MPGQKFEKVVLLMIVFAAVLFACDSGAISNKLETESVFVAYLNKDTATFVFKCLQSADIDIMLAFEEQDTHYVPIPPLYYTIYHAQGTQEKNIDISTWPDGEYKVKITEVGGGSSYLIRAIRKWTLPVPTPPSEPIKVAGIKTLFVDDWYIDQQSGLDRNVKPADLIPVKPWEVNASYFRYIHDILDFYFDEQGVLYVNISASNNGTSFLNLWMKSSDYQNWQVVSAPVGIKKASTYYANHLLTYKDKIVNRKPSSVTTTHRYYNPSTDGPVNLEQVEVITTWTTNKDLGNGIIVPAHSRAAIWNRPVGEYLVLTNPASDPIVTCFDEWLGDYDIGRFTNANDNYGHQTMSAAGDESRFYQARLVTRHNPYRVYYDNIFHQRILATWSSTNGEDWSPNFFDIPDHSQESRGLQHYSNYCFKEESDKLEMAFVRMYDAVTQKQYTELAYSRNGHLWHRINGQPFVANGAYGSWNFGMVYPGWSNFRVEWDGKYYEPVLGDDILHFMKLAVWGDSTRDHVDVDYFLSMSGGRVADTQKGIPSTEIWDWYGRSWDTIVSETIGSTTAAGIMCYRKDGWVSLSADSAPGQLTTRVLDAAQTLGINAETQPGGFVKVEVLDAGGTEIAAYCGSNAAVFTGDSVETQLAWSSGSITELPNVPLKLRITLQDANLYCLQWSPEPHVVYVKQNASGSHDGTSWTNAYTDIQTALKNAKPCDQIWVAQGIYKPTPTANSMGRYVGFELKNGVSLYGGFAGTETALEQRNVQTNPTILSGDLSGNDGANFTNYSENSLHVVVGDYVNQTAVLDGFTIKGGNANLSSPHDKGGGFIISDYGGPTVSSCTFTSNIAANIAGAACIRQGSALIRSCGFTNNAVSSQNAGALCVMDYGMSQVVDCYFSGNTAAIGGGALLVRDYADAVITGCRFEQNNAAYYGGAIMFVDSGDIEISDCNFLNNTSKYAGGIYNYRSSRTNVTNCYFLENQATESGGALRTNQIGTTEVYNCVFAKNTAKNGGAVSYETGHQGYIYNSTFYDNSASTSCNAVYLLSGSALSHIANCVFSDGGDEIAAVSSALSVDYCNVQGGYSGTGSNNIDLPPLFEDPDNGNYRLTTNSPCVNTGDSSVVAGLIGWDIDHNYRIAGTSIDMGAYEFGSSEYLGFCGDDDHPFPAGDFDQDCRVNLSDFSMLAANWLGCTGLECSEYYLSDLELLAINWLSCTAPVCDE